MQGNIILRFPDSTQNFTNGFEAGMVYALLMSSPEIIDTSDGFPVQRENIDLYINMAEHLGYNVSFHRVKCKGAGKGELEELNKQWVNVIFMEKRV